MKAIISNTRTPLFFMALAAMSYTSVQGQNNTDAFITLWRTTTANESITIPTIGDGYNYSVDWGDNSSDANQTDSITHQYADADEYVVTITGDFPRIYFNADNDGRRDNEATREAKALRRANAAKLLEIKQWGTQRWADMFRAFRGCRNLRITATDVPDLSQVTSTGTMFHLAANFTSNASISEWDMSNVKFTSWMFRGARAFNQPLNWDVSAVTDMSAMFWDAAAFNQDINDWDVSAVTDMSYMFTNAVTFDQPLNKWEVEKVEDMSRMFWFAASFNQPLNNWKVGKVKNMRSMFNRATAFDQDISGWDVSAVTDMRWMFWGARDFNQNLGRWNIANTAQMNDMLHGASSLSSENYTLLLNGWAARTSLPNVPFGAPPVRYCNTAQVSVDTLNNRSWTISGANTGVDCTAANDADAFITVWRTTEADESIAILTGGLPEGVSYNYSVDWGDNSSDANQTRSIVHQYSNPGEYLVTITGDFPRIYFNGDDDGKRGGADDARRANAVKLREIRQWGTQAWTSMFGAFRGCRDLRITATDVPNLSSVTSTASMFHLAANFTSNASISEWDMSNVQTTSWMFRGARAFNQPLNWDVSAVTDMSAMFWDAAAFNQDISGWDVGKVTNMLGMFLGATAFNQNLSNWDVSKVKDMRGMFSGASAFNQDISRWDVGKVTQMRSMFWGARAFDQNIGNWNVSKVADMTTMFNYATGFSVENYTSLLEGWAARTSLEDSVAFGAPPVGYCRSAAAARAKLTAAVADSGLKWDITGDTGITPETTGFTVTNPDAICTGEPINLADPAIAEAGQQGSVLSYWANQANDDTLSGALTGDDREVSPAATTTYYIQKSTGCSPIVKPVTVTVKPLPDVAGINLAANPTQVCASGEDVVFTISGKTNAFQADDVVHYTFGGTSETHTVGSAGNSFTITETDVNTARSFTLTRLVRNGCESAINAASTDIALKTIPDNVTAALAAGQEAAVCAGSGAVNFTISGADGDQVVYRSIEAGTAGIPNTGTVTLSGTSAQVSVTPAAEASGVVLTLVRITRSGCTFDDLSSLPAEAQSASVTVNPLPEFSVSDAAVCVGNSTALTAAVSSNAGTDGVLTYYTDRASDGTLSGELTAGNTTVSPSATTVYYVQKVHNTTRCAAVKEVTVEVNDAVPTDFTVTNPSAICEGNKVNLADPAIAVSGQQSSVLSYWANRANDGTLSGALTGDDREVSPTANKTYYLEKSTGCGDPIVKAVEVTVKPKPADFTVTNPPAICLVQPIDLTAAASSVGTDGTLSYWEDEEATNNALSTPTELRPADTRSYYIKKTGANACFITKEVMVTVKPLPDVAGINLAAGTTDVCPAGEDVVFTISGKTNAFQADDVLHYTFGGVNETHTVGSAGNSFTITKADVNTARSFTLTQLVRNGCESAINAASVDIALKTIPDNVNVALAAGQEAAVCAGTGAVNFTISGADGDDIAYRLIEVGTAGTPNTGTATLSGTSARVSVTPAAQASGVVLTLVRITRSGCTFDDLSSLPADNIGSEVSIKKLPVDFGLSPLAICPGETIDLPARLKPHAGSDGNLTYWTNRAQDGTLSGELTAGNRTVSPDRDTRYYVQKSNDCGSVTEEAAVTVHPKPNLAFTYPKASYATHEANPSPQMTGANPQTRGDFTGSNGLTFADRLKGIIDLSGSTLGEHIVTYRYQTQAGCRDETSFKLTLTASPPLSVEKMEDGLSLFPIPTSANLHLRMENTAAGMVHITLSNLAAQPIAQWIDLKDKAIWQSEVDLSHVPAGTYVLTLTIEGQQWSHKIAKQ